MPAHFLRRFNHHRAKLGHAVIGKREIGPEIEIAANGSRCSSKNTLQGNAAPAHVPHRQMNNPFARLGEIFF